MRVLIIKTGHTETFDRSEASLSVVSLGDVLRTTTLLHLFKNCEVTWFTSAEALPLLQNNPYINNLTTKIEELFKTPWDLVVNLEKNESALNFLKVAQFKKKVGFDENSTLRTESSVFDFKQMAPANWSEKLFYLLGKNWDQEPYVFHPLEKKKPEYHLGLNWKVGSKWSSKSWPYTHWENIYTRVKDQYRTSWQQGFDNLNEYISWIQSCETLLTHDSLGLHLGLALGKPMVALFGPTLSKEIPLKNTIVLSQSEKSEFLCPPCYQQLCHNKIHCVGSLSVEVVDFHLQSLMQGKNGKFAT